VVEALALVEGLTVVDATVGMGGHALAIAARLGSGGILIGIDRDPSVLEPARQRLAGVAPRVELRHASYTSLVSLVRDLGLPAVDRVLMDLGVGSHQLDSPGRGLSFRHDGPLDMRFDPTTGPTALELLERASEQQLADWFHELGEERHARRIARALVRARGEKRLPRTTRQLADAVARAVPPVARSQRLHPATRVFQALRIAVNQELEALEAGLEQAEAVLAPGGRLAVISFHSLEDRRVKHFQRARMQPVGKKPIRPGAEEVHANPRSRSAKLRVAVKVTALSDPRASCQEAES
jgi:16S rRNA (cytosine1402-N4)-methyltransferase